MNQQAYQEITKMLNAFPQSAADLRGLLLTYDEDTTGIPDAAIVEASQRFRRGQVEGQNKTFAPSVAEFCDEARDRAKLIAIRNRPRLPKPEPDRGLHPAEKRRMKFKFSLLQKAMADGRADQLHDANRKGMLALIELARQWGLPVEEGLEAAE